jgi:hypothetical protein
MATILTQMGGDAVSACTLRQDGRTNGVGVCRTTRIANGCNMINIHTKS